MKVRETAVQAVVCVSLAIGAVELPHGKIVGREVTNGVTLVRFELTPESTSHIRGVVALPPKAKWNGRLKGFGGGGPANTLNVNGPLGAAMGGWAAVYSDLGSSRGVKTSAQVRDFGHRATHLACVTAKTFVRETYGREADHAYFIGGSTGGGQGFHEALRYPEDYDGIISMVPANTRLPLHMYFAWNLRLLSDAAGRPFFTDAELNAVEEAGIDVFCETDAFWARGRFLTDSRYTLEREQKVTARAIERMPSLDTPEKRERLHKLFTGPVINGRQIHAGVPFSARLKPAAGNQWMLSWFLPQGRALHTVTDEELLEWERTWGPDCTAADPDISAFAARGGKLLVWAGLEDPICPYPALLDWHAAATKRVGADTLNDCCRVYLLPGLAHGRGRGLGGVDDAERILMDWVEKGQRPETVSGSLLDGTKIPLKPYPACFEAPDAWTMPPRNGWKGPNGRYVPTYPSAHDPATSRVRDVPAFLRGAVMYQLFTRMFTPEGTFKAAEAKLPELKALGVDVVYLTPHQLADDDPDPTHWSARQKQCRFGNPKNPYRQKDFYAVDPEYGTASDLKNLVAAAHRLGLKVMFDLVYFHCGPKAVFLQTHPDFIVRNADGSPRLGDWAFPELNIRNPTLREYLYANMTGFLRDYDVDGFRCDVADMMPVAFWEEAYRRCKAVKSDVFLMCEGLKGDDQIAAFDLSYGFYTQWALVDMLAGKKPASELRKAWEGARRDFPQGFHWMRCFENHDFANVVSGQKRKEELYGPVANATALATLFLLDGVPMLYNGQEIADASPHAIFANRDHGGWCIDWTKGNSSVAQERRALVKRLTALRHAHPALFDAPLDWLDTGKPESVYAFRRRLPEGAITFAANISEQTVDVVLDGRMVSLVPHGFFCSAFSL